MAMPPHPWSPRNLCPLLRKQDLHVQTGRSRLALGKRHLNSPRRNWSFWKNPACLQRGKRDVGVLTSVCSGVGDRLMAQLCWPGTQDGTWAPPGRTAQAEQAPGGLPHRTSRHERWRVEGVSRRQGCFQDWLIHVGSTHHQAVGRPESQPVMDGLPWTLCPRFQGPLSMC